MLNTINKETNRLKVLNKDSRVKEKAIYKNLFQ